MSAQYTLRIQVAGSGDKPILTGLTPRDQVLALIKNLKAILGGRASGESIRIQDTTVAASGTITLATLTAGSVIEINGVPFTAITGSVTSGNDEIDIDGDNTADAVDLARAINACTDARIARVLTATSSGAVVTLTPIATGAVTNAITIKTLGVVATGTITCAGVDEDDTVTINGVTLTCKTTVTDATTQWAVGASNAANATNLANLINSTATSALITGHVRAMVRSNVVHLYAKYPGVQGNCITLASSDGTDLAVSGARLTGGLKAQSEGAQATGTVTISSGSGATAATINGVACSVTWASSDDNTATLLANKINETASNALIGHLVVATAATNVVTITAVQGGVSGNAITLSASGTGVTASGARLTGGAVPTTAVFSGERLSGGSNDAANTVSLPV